MVTVWIIVALLKMDKNNMNDIDNKIYNQTSHISDCNDLGWLFFISIDFV